MTQREIMLAELEAHVRHIAALHEFRCWPITQCSGGPEGIPGRSATLRHRRRARRPPSSRIYKTPSWRRGGKEPSAILGTSAGALERVIDNDEDYRVQFWKSLASQVITPKAKNINPKIRTAKMRYGSDGAP